MSVIDPKQSFPELSRMEFGVYICQECGNTYTVNEPHSWRPCSPFKCHDCLEKESSMSTMKITPTVVRWGS